MFFDEFDLNLYKKNFEKNDNEMNTIYDYEHYFKFGIDNGYICSLGQFRQNFYNINKNFNKCLEIGPFDCPIIKGDNVKYCDVLSKEELVQRAINGNRLNNLNNIQHINFVTKNINDINENFDLVVSSHLIEHQTNFVKHLQDVEKILNNNGFYLLIIPDKRYCFDYFIENSTIAEILNSYYLNNKIHTLKSIIEHRCYTTHNNCVDHWNGKHGKLNIDLHKLNLSIKEYEDSVKNNNYVDVHSLQFTPQSFKEIINQLEQLSLINLKIHKIYNTAKNNIEFIVILQKK